MNENISANNNYTWYSQLLTNKSIIEYFIGQQCNGNRFASLEELFRIAKISLYIGMQDYYQYDKIFCLNNNVIIFCSEIRIIEADIL